MDECCNAKAGELSALATSQKKVLIITLVINALMFFLEFTYGSIARSTSLVADSLDMLGDAFVYGISLYAIGRSVKWNSSVSLTKGVVMASFGVWVLIQAFTRFSSVEPPNAATMGVVGALALVANITCAALLLRFRNDDLNMRSTWLCSRNDVISNLAVLAAAGLVSFTRSKYPDLIVGIGISSLILYFSVQVLRESYATLRSS